MLTRKKIYRKKLAEQMQSLITASVKIFGNDALDPEWIKQMLDEIKKITNSLTIYQFLDDLSKESALDLAILDIDQEDAVNHNTDQNKTHSHNGHDAINTSKIHPLQNIHKSPIDFSKTIDKSDTIKDIKPINNKDTTGNTLKQPLFTDHTPKEKHDLPADSRPEEIKVELVSNSPISANTDQPTHRTIEENTHTSHKQQIDKVGKKNTNNDQIIEINDVISLPQTSLADTLRNHSIQKLTDGIALNDRLLYAKELFNGSMDELGMALREMDFMTDTADVHRYINLHLKMEYEWTMESDTVISFMDFISRKFN